MVVAIALPIMAYGIIYSKVLTVIGGAILLMGIYAWSLEPSVAAESDYDPPAQGGEPTKELVGV
jgi:cytochrome c oxidase subunit 1